MIIGRIIVELNDPPKSVWPYLSKTKSVKTTAGWAEALSDAALIYWYEFKFSDIPKPGDSHSHGRCSWMVLVVFSELREVGPTDFREPGEWPD